MIKTILEDVADNLCHPDPYYQQGGDMVRVGGMSYTINVDAPMGQRIADMRVAATGAPDPGRQGLRRVGLGLGQRGRGGPAGLGRPGRPPQDRARPLPLAADRLSASSVPRP